MNDYYGTFFLGKYIETFPVKERSVLCTSLPLCFYFFHYSVDKYLKHL